MREIKFRAWDGTKLCQVRNIDFGADGSIYSVRIVVPYETSDNDVDFDFPEIPVETSIIEQFTGLRDRNGKEIYEGDVIAGGKKGEHCVVTFCTNIGRWVAFGKSYTVYPSRFYLFEVIGNIHEYPHLMEGGKQ